MSFAQTTLLGFIAGATIFLSLPLGRLRGGAPRLKSFLNAASAGILLFLLFEIFHQAFAPLEGSVERIREGEAAWGSTVGFGSVLFGGLAVGLLSLLYLGGLLRSRRPSPQIGPGAMAMAEARAAHADSPHMALDLAMSIALGIGLHNFSEGLAIGSSAKSGDTQLALLLVIGFALHNATEGFGIIGPLAAGGVRASWPFLLMVGGMAGAPTFVGTLIGFGFQNAYVSVAFLALASGAIIYVIAELLNIGRKLGAWPITVWGVLAGIALGAVTDLIIVAAGG